ASWDRPSPIRWCPGITFAAIATPFLTPVFLAYGSWASARSGRITVPIRVRCWFGRASLTEWTGPGKLPGGLALLPLSARVQQLSTQRLELADTAEAGSDGKDCPLGRHRLEPWKSVPVKTMTSGLRSWGAGMPWL